MNTTANNRVQLIGFLGQEIEVKEYAEGKKFARMAFATHEYRRTPEGRKEVVTMWHNLIAWDKTAKRMYKGLSKGQRLLIEGKIDYHDYTGKDDVKRSIMNIVVSDYKRLEPSDK